ncbi:phage tail sheath subtilisin-like domain-containing protein [Brevundimonas nasdae]|uniref:phage tail sheath subtilisin-like domain-containing protein n=1 Tax=Brevundimonas nasdae TaxID=172043 RepID=UPI003F690BFF
MPIEHGVFVTEITEGARDLQTIATAVIGLVGTAPAAVAGAFPLNTPVLVTNITQALADIGATGTLPTALAAIFDQASPVVVVINVAEGTGEGAAEATLANIIGTAAAKSGIYGLLAAETTVGVRPRILGVPGFGSQTVTAALVTVAQKLRAFAYAGCDTADTVAEAITYRDQFSARELMLIWPDVSSGDAVARAMGLRARIDEEQGWHKSLSNVAMNGVTGLSQPIFFDLQDASSDAGVLNAGSITTIVNRDGYRFWGNRTCSDEPLFAFETAVRTAQVLRDTIAEGLLWAADKPLHPSLARDILETINNEFRQLKAQGRIIDARAWLDPSLNTQASLAAGQLNIDYDYTPVPPLERIGLQQRITDRYLADFADQVNGTAVG